MIKTRVGNLVRVENKNKVKTANREYLAVVLKQNSSYGQYLFTDVEIAVAKDRARKNSEDLVGRTFISEMID